MIIKKQSRQPDRKASPVIGLLLFVISVFLLLVTGPLGFLYGLLYSLFRKGVRGLGEYLLKIAISIDQLGNVLMQHLLNLVWIRKGGYLFGNRDETISSALGRNRQLGTLSGFGRGIDKFLDLIDPNHSLNSIDYYIEPSPAIIDWLSWICIKDRKLLFLREAGTEGYFLPGTSKIPEESDAGRLSGYLQQMLGIQARSEGLQLLGVYESRYAMPKEAAFLRQHCYSMPYEGILKPGKGIQAIYWLGYTDLALLNEAGQAVMQGLKEKGMI